MKKISLLVLLVSLVCGARAAVAESSNVTNAAHATIDELLIRYATLGLERQESFKDSHPGGGNWGYDVDSERLTFGPKRSFHAQILGTYSAKYGTWMWAWANEESHLPEALLQLARSIRAIAEKEKWEFFTTPEWVVPQSELHAIALISAGLAGTRAYYIGTSADEKQPTVVFLVDDQQVADLPPTDLLHLQTIFMSAISAFTIRDHERALRAYATARGFTVTGAPPTLTITDAKGCSLIATIDAQHRIAKMKLPDLKAACIAPRPVPAR